jgi:hypothetical protein
MSKPTIEEILAPIPEVRPRLYTYSIADQAHKGLLKVGQTTRDDGSIFTDHEVRAALARKGFENVELEWMRCSVKEDMHAEDLSF